MEKPKYLERLLRQKVLLIVGLIVAVVAGILAGFTIHDGAVTTRVQKAYSASSTVLLSSPQPTYFQVEIPGAAQALPQPNADGTTPAQELIVEDATPLDLADTAIILAYIASSDEVAEGVQESVGVFEDGEGITAVRRTTQPAGDERFGGRLSLPIIDIVATATSPVRAELIADEALDVFADLVQEQQREWGVSEEIRLELDVLNAPVADTGEGSNPAIPVIVVAMGVFIFFIALALILDGILDRRRRRTDAASEGDAAGEDAASDGAAAAEDAADETSAQEEVLVSADAAGSTTEPDASRVRREQRRRQGARTASDAGTPEGEIGTDPGSLSGASRG